MAIKRMPIGLFVAGVKAAIARHDGYIMGAKGQDPKKWGVNNWYFAQYRDRDNYTDAQEKKALYWREHAERVWDCNGLAEGLNEEWSGVNINTKARYNYSGWCGVKGKGMIPEEHRVPGAAVFHGKTAATITHVMYLLEPVDPANPAGDWYLGEARSVLKGCVQTRLYERKPDYWGIMDKYFDYGDADYVPAWPELGEVILRSGMQDREDVKTLQQHLIDLGYDLGKWGADGDFGDATEMAVIAFQRANGCDPDGEYGPKTHAALMAVVEAMNTPVETPSKVQICGGSCWVRIAPNTSGGKLDAVKAGTELPYAGETSDNGWLKVEFRGETGWVSGKYGRLVE